MRRTVDAMTIPAAPAPDRHAALPVLLLRCLLVSACAGGAFGAVTVALNMASWEPLTGVAAVVGGAAGWAGAGWGWAYVIGRRYGRWPVSAAAAAVFLLAASAAYYSVEAAWSLARLRTMEPPAYPVPGGDLGYLDASWVELMVGATGELVLWGTVSVLAGVALGVVTSAARRSGVVGLLSRLTLPIGVLLWSGVLLHFELGIQPRPAVVTAHVLAGLMALGAAVVLLQRERAAVQHRRTMLEG